MSRCVRIGAGAGFSGDRIDPAVELVEKAELDYLVFECLAERTIALAQAARRNDPLAGFDPLLDQRMRAVLPLATRRGVRIVSNMGAANPDGAAEAIVAIARDLGLKGLKVAAVTGDDVSDIIRSGDYPLTDREGSSSDLGEAIVSANAYLGAEGVVDALHRGADVIVTGRICDPALFLAPLIHEFGWPFDDWPRLGAGTLVGHLLECAGQLTGGYYADPGYKDVPDLARLGFPFAAVAEDGSALLGKVEGSGGLLNVATCKEQLLYEVLDPGAYLQADVNADFRGVEIEQAAHDRVAVRGGGGRPRPETLKVSIGYDDGYIGEGRICYAGPGARARAELALDIVRERLRIIGAEVHDVRFELIGIDALSRSASEVGEPQEIMARIVGRAASGFWAHHIGAEVEALYTNGPSGGGGANKSVRKTLAIASTLIPRDLVRPSVLMRVS